MARERNYAAEYAARKAKAAQQGTTPARKRYTRERSEGRFRDYREERERRELQARGRGFTGVREQAAFRKANPEATPADTEAYQKRRTLEKFGISEATFNRYRRENKRWSYGSADGDDVITRRMGGTEGNAGARGAALLRNADKAEYRLEVDRMVHTWTENRVGYVVAFYRANVDPRTNYDRLTRNGRDRYNRRGQLKTNRAQYDYLVTYGKFLSVTEFEVRYGRNQVPK